MEILFLLTSVVIVVLLSTLTYTNYKTVKVLRKDLDNLNLSLEQSHIVLRDRISTLLINLEEVHKSTVDYVDSKNKLLNDTLNDVTKEQEININYNREQIKGLSLNIESLVKEIKKVETGYKEKINY